MFSARCNTSLPGVLVWELAGEGDLETAPSLQGLFECPSPEPLVVLECSRLLLLDAAGMSAVVVGARILGAAGGRLVVVGATRSVRRVLRLTRVAEAVPMFSTMHEALGWYAINTLASAARAGPIGG